MTTPMPLRRTTAATMLTLACTLAGCTPPPPAEIEPAERLVLVLDPTVTAGDSARFEQAVAAPLREAIGALPPGVRLDAYIAGGTPQADVSGVLPEAHAASAAHRALAQELAELVVGSYRTEHRRLGDDRTRSGQRPPTCVLPSILNAEASLAAPPRGGSLTLTIISDHAERCPALGLELPDYTLDRRFPLPANVAAADLSGVSAVHLWTVPGEQDEAISASFARSEMWIELMERWSAQHVRPAPSLLYSSR